MTRRILIVEDVALVAMDLEMQATDAGWTVIGPASTIEQALHLVATAAFDAALLDVQLTDSLITPVAQALRARGVPFVFGSGHRTQAVLPAEFADAPCLEKPFAFAEVERLLADARVRTAA